VEQQWLVVVEEELVEGEPAGPISGTWVESR